MKMWRRSRLDLALARRAASGMPMFQLMGTGVAPQADAALALMMFATAATPQGEAVGRRNARAITTQLLDAAVAGGFQEADIFLDLVGSGRLTPLLRELAMEAVQAIGGAEKFFSMLELVTTPRLQMGAPQ